jgi:hypothetical protein
MPQAKKQKNKKLKKTKKDVRTKVTLVPEEDVSSKEEESEHKEDESEGGIYLEKEDMKLIYNALSAYKPTEDEEHLHSILLEEFEEIRVTDYGEPYPDTN